MFWTGITSALFALTTLVAAYPTSTNFSLKAYDLGGGGGGSGSSTNYDLNSELGVQGGASSSSTNFGIKPGIQSTQNANVPQAPTLTNPSNNEYSRLKLVINTSSNPSDTKYLIAISSDNFVTTRYVKSDNSIGNTSALTDYQTYSAWGGAGGFYITGLSSATTYKVKVKAMQGNYSESAYGPETSGVATVQPSLSFGVATNPPAGPPYSVSFTSLSSGTVHDAAADAELSLTTNALMGGSIYIKDSSSGLNSASASFSIPSVTTDLSSASSGYGAIVAALGQASGGPMSATSPFNGSSSNVGGLTTSLQEISSTTNPVVSGSVTVRLKAKTTAIMPAASDYSDVLTFIASMTY